MSKRDSRQKASVEKQDMGFISPGILLLVRLCALIALVVSVYLLYVTFGGGAVAGCGPDSGCDKVLQSRWSKWFGLPVSVFAVATYGAILVLSFKLNKAIPAPIQRDAWKVLLPLAVLVIASVLWFVGLQAFVLRHMCPYCMTVHGAGLIAAVSLLLKAPFRNPPDKSWQAEKQVFITPSLARKAVGVALFAFAIFAAGQVAYRPKTFSETSVTAPRQTARMFSVYDGKFQFDLNEVPLMGNPLATNTILSLFDYTCHHCRIMHWHLSEALGKLSNQLSIVSLPMPLDNKCNYTVTQTPRFHTNACDLAKLGLAVWRANRKVHHTFDDWVFTPEHAPSVPEAQQYAAQLVGSNQLAQALQDPWIQQQLVQGINVYATNYYHFRNGSMPQLIVGPKLTGGTFKSLDELYRLLDEHLGIKATTGSRTSSQPNPLTSG